MSFVSLNKWVILWLIQYVDFRPGGEEFSTILKQIVLLEMISCFPCTLNFHL